MDGWIDGRMDGWLVWLCQISAGAVGALVDCIKAHLNNPEVLIVCMKALGR
jgi:hypothetical protein